MLALSSPSREASKAPSQPSPCSGQGFSSWLHLEKPRSNTWFSLATHGWSAGGGGLDVLGLADVTPVRPSLQTWSQLSAVLTAQRMDGLPKARLWRLRLNAFPLQEASSCPHPSSGRSDHLSLDLFLLTESPVTLKSEMCFICTSLAPDAEPSAGSQVVKGKWRQKMRWEQRSCVPVGGPYAIDFSITILKFLRVDNFKKVYAIQSSGASYQKQLSSKEGPHAGHDQAGIQRHEKGPAMASNWAPFFRGPTLSILPG